MHLYNRHRSFIQQPKIKMRVSSSLAIKSLAASASASAVVTPRAGLDVNPGHNNDDKFVLQTHTINGAGYNGLYVYAYHAGAGNNAMLDTDRTVGNKATAHANRMFPYFVVQYFIGRSPYQLIPKPMGYSPYPGLLPVAINVNGDPPSATNAFYFEGNSLKWTDNTTTKGGFAGWLGMPSPLFFSFPFVLFTANSFQLASHAMNLSKTPMCPVSNCSTAPRPVRRLLEGATILTWCPSTYQKMRTARGLWHHIRLLAVCFCCTQYCD